MRVCFVCDRAITGEGSKTVHLGSQEMHFQCLLVYTLRKAKLNIGRNKEEKE